MTVEIPGLDNVVEVGSTDATTTYSALDTETGNRVVVTVLLRDVTDEVRARFEYDQGRAVDLSDHPNLREILGFGYTDDDRAFIVSEHVEGRSLIDAVDEGLDGPTVVSIGVRLAGALDSAHRVHVAHGDLRPEEIVLDQLGEPQLAGLGVVTVTGRGPAQSEEPAGLAHASPEQLNASPPTPASDVYSLGSVLFALLHGGPAYVHADDTSVLEVLKRIAGAPLPDLRDGGVPDPIVAVIERAMERDPKARWASAGDFGRALQQAEVALGLPITELPVSEPDEGISIALPPAIPRRPLAGPGHHAPAHSHGHAHPRRRRRRLVWGAIALVAVVGFVVALLAAGGDDSGDDDGDDGTATPRGTAAGFDGDTNIAGDDLGIILVEVPETWDLHNGEPIGNGFNSGEDVPDVVASPDPGAFLEALGTPGIRVTALDTEAVSDANDVDATNATVLMDTRTLATGQLADGQSIESACDRTSGRVERTINDFEGRIETFTGCPAGAIVVIFAGSDGDRSIIVEIHLTPDDNPAIVDPLLNSIEVDGIP